MTLLEVGTIACRNLSGRTTNQIARIGRHINIRLGNFLCSGGIEGLPTSEYSGAQVSLNFLTSINGRIHRSG